MANRVYMDYNATAKIRPEVIEAHSNTMGEVGNASSIHASGRAARSKVEIARKQVADLVGAEPEQIIFTSGGTEANNQIIGSCDPTRSFVSAIEHPAVMDACPNGIRFPVNNSGVVDLLALEKLLATTENPEFVCLMLANNETGVLQPIKEAANICKRYGARLHCDAVQAVGKVEVNFSDLGVETMAITAHKFGGPQGIGALIVRSTESANCMIRGGGQEQGLRGGTENVANIVAFGIAAEIAKKYLKEYEKLSILRDYLETTILNSTPDAKIFGRGADRLPNTSKLMMPGVSSEIQVMSFDLAGIEVSAGSACAAGRIEAPYVLKAMGVKNTEALCALRVSLGWDTDSRDIDQFIHEWNKIFQRVG